MGFMSVEDRPQDDGLTDAEGLVMDALKNAANAFGKLDRQHPSEGREFENAIHRCQSPMAVRIVRREHPEGWPTFKVPTQQTRTKLERAFLLH